MSVVITIKLVIVFVNRDNIRYFKEIGNTPWLKGRFIISLKGFENSFLNNFKILVGILFRLHALFVFTELIKSSMSLVELEKGKLRHCFLGRDRISVLFFFPFDLTILFYFFSNICKRVGNGWKFL